MDKKKADSGKMLSDEILKINDSDHPSTKAAKSLRKEFDNEFEGVMRRIYEWVEAKREEMQISGINIGFLFDMAILDREDIDYGCGSSNIENLSKPSQSAAAMLLRDKTDFLAHQVLALKRAKLYFKTDGVGGMGMSPLAMLAEVADKMKKEKKDA